MINISPDRSVYPSRIKVGNRFENGVEKIQFNIPKDISKRGYEYLILNKPGKNESYPIPLEEGLFMLIRV